MLHTRLGPQWTAPNAAFPRHGHKLQAVKTLGSPSVSPTVPGLDSSRDAYGISVGKVGNIVNAPRGSGANDVAQQLNQFLQGLEKTKGFRKGEQEKIEEDRRNSSAETSSSNYIDAPSTRGLGLTGKLQRSRPSTERKNSRRSVRKQASSVKLEPEAPPPAERPGFQLTREDEVELCLAIQDLRKIEQAREALNEAGNPSTTALADIVGEPSVQALQSRIERGRRARYELVEANRGIVVMFARRYSFTFGDVQLEDLMMEGAASLLHSAERFDPSKGVRFSTYAAWHLHSTLFDAVAELSSGVQIPAYMVQLAARVTKTEDRLEERLGRPATSAEVAAALKVSEQTLLNARKFKRTRSLDGMSKRKDSGSHSSWTDEITSNDDSDGLDVYLRREVASNFKQDLEGILCTLKPKEAQVLTAMYGLKNGVKMSKVEVAKKMKISTQMVSVLEGTAMRKLRETPARLGVLLRYLEPEEMGYLDSVSQDAHDLEYAF